MPCLESTSFNKNDNHRGLQMLIRVLVRSIRLYQLIISPWLGASCKFYPSCSQYAIQALSQKGLLTGLWLTVKRLCKCNPFHSGGHDPIV